MHKAGAGALAGPTAKMDAFPKAGTTLEVCRYLTKATQARSLHEMPKMHFFSASPTAVDALSPGHRLSSGARTRGIVRPLAWGTARDPGHVHWSKRRTPMWLVSRSIFPVACHFVTDNALHVWALILFRRRSVQVASRPQAPPCGCGASQRPRPPASSHCRPPHQPRVRTRPTTRLGQLDGCIDSSPQRQRHAFQSQSRRKSLSQFRPQRCLPFSCPLVLVPSSTSIPRLTTVLSPSRRLSS